MGASRSSSVSSGRSLFKNQPVFAGVELTKNLENAPVFTELAEWRQHENRTDQTAENDLHLF